MKNVLQLTYPSPDDRIAYYLAKCFEDEGTRLVLSFMIIEADGDITEFVRRFRLSALKQLCLV